MKNKKGFTLVELLVVIVILGIITGLSIPLIRNVSASMEKKKYKTYSDSLLNASKLYNDSYSEDLFGHNENGCAYVTYEQLEDKNLLKDIEVSDVSCNSSSTFVRIIKVGDKYSYTPFLGCGKKKDGKANRLDTTLPIANHANEMKVEYCTGTEENNLEIVTVPEKSVEYDKKKKKTKIKITSGTGINNQIKIGAKWSTSETDYGGTFNNVSFKVPGDQKAKLLNGEIISTQSPDITTIDNATGKYYLILKVEQLQDLYGSKWKNKNKNDNTNPKYISFGPFAVDNHKPDADFVINSTSQSYNTLDTNIVITANDEEVGKNLKYCVSKKNDNCNPTNKYDDNMLVSLKSDGGYDGNERTVYIAVKDLAGNITRVSKKYEVGIKHTLIYNTTGGMACNPTTLSIIHKKNDSTKWGRDGDLCIPVKTGYKFMEWNTKRDGTGTKVDKNTVVNGNITVYAIWKSPPTCTISVSGYAGNNGWYRTNTTLNLNINGTATSYGINEAIPTNNGQMSAVVTDGNHYYFGYVENEAGSSICSTFVNVDTKPPSCVLSFNGTDGGIDWNYYDLSCSDNAGGSGCVGDSSGFITYYGQLVAVYDYAGNSCQGPVEYLNTTLHYIPGGSTDLGYPIPTFDTIFGDPQRHPGRVSNFIWSKKVSFIRYIGANGTALFKKSDITPYKLNFDVINASKKRSGRYYGTTAHGGYWTIPGVADQAYVYEYTDMTAATLKPDLYACYLKYNDSGTAVDAEYCADGNIYDAQ